MTQHTMVHEQMSQFFRGFRRDSHPMAMLVGVTGSLSAFYHDSLDITDAYHRHVSAIRLIAKLPTLVAMCHKYTMGQPFVYPRNELSYTANFMRMMFSVPCEDYKINDVLVRADLQSCQGCHAGGVAIGEGIIFPFGFIGMHVDEIQIRNDDGIARFWISALVFALFALTTLKLR